MAEQNFRVKRGLEVGIGGTVLTATQEGRLGVGVTNPTSSFHVNGNSLITGITTVGSLDTTNGTIDYLSGTNVSYSGIGTIATLDTTNGTIDYLEGTNISYSGIGSIATLDTTNGTIDYLSGTNVSYSGIGTVETLDTTTGTIDYLSGTNVSYSGIGTVETLDTTNGTIDYLEGTNVSYSGIGTIATLDTTTGTIDYLEGTNLNTSGIGTIATLDTTNGTIDYLSGTNVSYSGIGTVETLDTTNGTIDYLFGTNVSYSGIGTIATLDTTNGTIDYLENTNLNTSGIGTIATLDTTTGTIDYLSGTHISISGIGSIPTLDTTNGGINYLSGVNLTYSGIGSITKLQSTNASIGIATVTTLNVTTGSINNFVGVGATFTNVNVTGVSTFNDQVNIYSSLSIQGSVGINTTIYDSTFVIATSGEAQPELMCLDGTSNSNRYGLFAQYGSETTITSRNGNSYGTIKLNQYDGSIVQTSIIIPPSGNIGIGTTNPTSKLTVRGTTSLETLNVSGVTTSTEFHTGSSGSAIRVTSDTISGPATINIDPSGVGDNTGLVVIKGDLQVDGTQTIVNSTVVTVDDKNLLLGSGALNDAAADGGGITLESADGNKTLNWVDSTDSWTSSENFDLVSGKVYKIAGTQVLSSTLLSITNINASGVVTASSFTGNVTGNLDGIATQASKLLTSRDFSLTGDVVTTASGSFDGSSNLNLVTRLSNTFNANTSGIITATRFNSTNLNVSGIATINQVNLTGLSPDGSSFGIVNYVPVADGTGGWSWQPIAAAGGGSLDGVTILEEGSAVGAAGSVISINFVGNNVTATANGTAATITLSDNPSFGNVTLSGIITASSFVKSGGTSSQFLKADGTVDTNTYLTSYTETDTLDLVTGRGNTTSNGISVGILTASSIVKSGGTSSQFLKADGTVDSSTYLTSYTETDTLNSVTGRGNSTSNGISVGIVTASNQIKIESSDSNPGRIDLFCEVGNVHYTRLQAAPHSEYSGNAVVNLPAINGDMIVGNTDVAISKNINTTGIITASSIVKSGGTSSQFLKADGTVDSSTYLTSYTETDTLNSVTGRGNSTSNGISVGILTASSIVKSGGTSSQFLKADGTVDTNTYLTSYTETDTLDLVTGRGNTTSNGISVGFLTATAANISGVVTATDFNSSSDINLKDNVRLIEDPIAKVMSIRGVNFEWKETSETSAGIIAQEVEKIMPELVKDSGDKKTVNYNGLIGLLIEVVKEQQKQIDELRGKL